RSPSVAAHAAPAGRPHEGWHTGVAALLAQLVEHLHGKEGVDGSSPSEGSAKSPHVGRFSIRSTCRFSRVQWVWSRLWSSEDLPTGVRRDLTCFGADRSVSFERRVGS